MQDSALGKTLFFRLVRVFNLFPDSNRTDRPYPVCCVVADAEVLL